MGLTVDDYVTQQQALLPRGAAWPRDANALLTQLLQAKAAEFARIDARAEVLSIEANPATTSELLADWERVCGLPDVCVGVVEPTTQGRQDAVVSKLAGAGSASIPYLVGVAQALGFDVSIEEPRPLCADSGSAGDACYGDDWIYAWLVRAPVTSITYFSADVSCADEPLESWGNDILECRFNGIKPAHTIVLFAYGVVDPILIDDTGLAITGGDGLALAE